MSTQITTAITPSRETTTQASAVVWIKTLSVATLLPLLGLVGCVLTWRRLAGALDEPLGAWTLTIAAVVFAAASLTVRVLGRDYRRPDTCPRPWLAAAILLLPTAAVAAGGFSLSLPHTSRAGLAFLWGILAAGELSGMIFAGFSASSFDNLTARIRRPAGLFKSAAAARRLRFDTAHEPASHDVEQAPSQPHADLGPNSPEPAADPAPATIEETPHGALTQQVTRRQASDGTETMSGWLRASFLPGQRTASVHLAFCPPFSNTPTVEVEQVGGPPGRIKTVQLLPYGARFDLKLLKDAEEPLGVLLQFSARA